MNSVTFNIINGTQPYIVYINPGSYEYVYLTNGIKTIEGLGDGDYMLSITDGNECFAEQSFTITTTTTTEG